MKNLSKESLIALSVAAIENADLLLGEAEVLLAKEHFPRSYFLAIACIEEIDKASLAFTAAGRDLANPKVAKKTRENLLSHKSKILSGFGPSLVLTEKSAMTEALETTIELTGALRRGREPAMYTEILPDGSIQRPSDVVRPVAARDSVRLARHCLERATVHLTPREPPMTSVASDFFYTLPLTTIHQMMSQPKFSDFYLARIKQGDVRLEEALYDFASRAAAEPIIRAYAFGAA